MHTESDRKIYGPYSTGEKQVWGDPLRLYRRLSHALDGRPNDWLVKFNKPDQPEYHDAKERVLAAVVWAFELVPFHPESGQGLLEAEVEGLLRDFTGYLEKNGLPVATLPTWSRPLESESSARSPVPYPMKRGCGCG